MRFTTILSLLLAVLFISSCGDDDAPSISIATADVAGTWKVDKLDTDAELIAVNVGVTTGSSITSGEPTITFNDDGTWTSEGEFTNSVTIIAGTSMNMEDGLGDGTYRVSGNKIFMTGLELNNSSAPAATEEIEFFVEGFTADMSLDLMASPNNIIRAFGIENGAKADIKMVLLK